MSLLKYHRNMNIFARELRSNMTVAETVLWKQIRKRQIYGVQFYRQKPLGIFIVDFFAPKAKIVIEVDGEYHQESNILRNDHRRDQFFKMNDILVLRYSNDQVLHNFKDVFYDIRNKVKARKHKPNKLCAKHVIPLLVKEGRERSSRGDSD